jgi:erythronate-4-phosphate dehydrogenase
MVFEAFTQWAGLSAAELSAPANTQPLALKPASVTEAILDCYDVAEDHQRMVEAMAAAGSEQQDAAHSFDQLRKDYPVRREFSYYGIDSAVEDLAQYRSLGFSIL